MNEKGLTIKELMMCCGWILKVHIIMNETKEIFHKKGLELPMEEAVRLLKYGGLKDE